MICEGREDMFWYNKQDSKSHTNCVHRHTLFLADKTLTAHWCSGVCVTGRVQPLARWHECCERSQGQHFPHRTSARQQQSGRRRRRCSCKSPAGNGSDVQDVCVQGVCLLSKQMSLCKVVSRVGVFKLLCSVRSFFFVILLVAWRKTFTQVCGVGGVRGLFST